LEHLSKIEPTRVDIVEGAKDVAADLSLGNEAYGLPGTGIRPPKQVVESLRKWGHTLRVCMDGDEAGIKSQDEIVAYFIENGFPADRISKHPMPAGQDITDILVARVEARRAKSETPPT
jgi:DNA primase